MQQFIFCILQYWRAWLWCCLADIWKATPSSVLAVRTTSMRELDPATGFSHYKKQGLEWTGRFLCSAGWSVDGRNVLVAKVGDVVLGCQAWDVFASITHDLIQRLPPWERLADRCFVRGMKELESQKCVSLGRFNSTVAMSYRLGVAVFVSCRVVLCFARCSAVLGWAATPYSWLGPVWNLVICGELDRIMWNAGDGPEPGPEYYHGRWENPKGVN